MEEKPGTNQSPKPRIITEEMISLSDNTVSYLRMPIAPEQGLYQIKLLEFLKFYRHHFSLHWQRAGCVIAPAAWKQNTLQSILDFEVQRPTPVKLWEPCWKKYAQLVVSGYGLLGCSPETQSSAFDVQLLPLCVPSRSGSESDLIHSWERLLPRLQLLTSDLRLRQQVPRGVLVYELINSHDPTVGLWARVIVVGRDQPERDSLVTYWYENLDLPYGLKPPWRLSNGQIFKGVRA
jgi:hypothetical protein